MPSPDDDDFDDDLDQDALEEEFPLGDGSADREALIYCTLQF